MMAFTILEPGLASCVIEQRCRHNLEGYGLSESYRFERCQDEKGRYCRVYPDRSLPGYYKTCGFAFLTSSPVKNWSKAYFEFVFRSQVFA